MDPAALRSRCSRSFCRSILSFFLTSAREDFLSLRLPRIWASYFSSPCLSHSYVGPAQNHLPRFFMHHFSIMPYSDGAQSRSLDYSPSASPSCASRIAFFIFINRWKAVSFGRWLRFFSAFRKGAFTRQPMHISRVRD